MQAEWRKKSALGVTVKGGKQNCALKTPVEGDSLAARPDRPSRRQGHREDREGGPQGRLRRRLGPLRSQGRLRVPGLPEDAQWELLKNAVVLEKGKDNAVKGIKKRNALEIRAKGDTIVGKVNGKSMVSYKDPAPDDVKAPAPASSTASAEGQEEGGGRLLRQAQGPRPEPLTILTTAAPR